MRNRLLLAAVGAALLGLVLAGAAPAQPPGPPPAGPPPVGPGFFGANVRPILLNRCTSCHGASVQRGGLRLDDREAALKGGASGAVIVPGNAGASKLYQMVASKKMPLDAELSLLELENLKDWIDGGAPWPAPRVIPNLTLDPRVDAFRLALRNADRAGADALIADPTFAKARGKGASTALHHAVVYGDISQVRALLDKGADVNAVNQEGVTPLIWAVRDEAIVRLLVERGADVNAASDAGVTPLLAAVGRANAAPLVAYLLDKGAKPAPVGGLAGALGTVQNFEALKLIFPNVLPVNGPAAAGAAATSAVGRCYQCLDYLIAQGARGPTLNGALVSVANTGDVAKVKRLLDVGATLDGKGPQDATVLIAATMSDYQALEKVNLLLAAGADLNAPDAHGRTPLFYARKLHPEIVPVLTAKGAK